MSLIKKHKQRVLAKKQMHEDASPTVISVDLSKSKDYSASSGVNQSVLKNGLLELKEKLPGDIKLLKTLSGDAERNEYKRELIENKYKPLIDVLLDLENWGNQEPIFWWLMWRIDTDTEDQIIDLLNTMKLGVERGLTTPVDFKRDWPTIYLDTLFVLANEAIKKDEVVFDEFISDAVEKLSSGDLVTNHPLKAKIYAINGKQAKLKGDLKTAKYSFETALNLNSEIGVKTLLKDVIEKMETEKDAEKQSEEK